MTEADASGRSVLSGDAAAASTAERFRTVTVATAIAIGGYLVGNLFAAALLVTVNAIGAATGIALPDPEARQVLLATIGVQGLGFGGTAYYVLTRFDPGPGFVRVDRPGLGTVAAIVGGFVGLLALNVGVERLFRALDIQTGGSALVDSAVQNPALGVVLIVLSLVLVGPAEELLYRGVVQTTFKGAVGTPGAIVATGLVFASIHLFGITGTLEARIASIGVVFVLALFLGALYELTDDLVVPAVVHGLYNATTFAIAVVGLPNA